MRLAIVLAVALALGGCGTPTAVTPAPVSPNSPIVQAHNINKTFADAINTAVKTAIAARDQGKLSPAITRQIEDWSGPASIISDKIEMEIQSTDTWTIQKQKILLLLTTFKLPGTGPVDATVQAALSAVGVLLSQFQMQVSQ